MLVFKNCLISYKGLKHTVSNVNLTCLPSQLNLITGNNGVGKSTIVKSLYDQDIVVQGKINYKGYPIINGKVWNLAHLVNHLGVYIAPQTSVLLPGVSLEVLCANIGHKRHNLSEAETKIKVQRLTKLFGLPESYQSKDFNCNNSGGEKKINEMIQLVIHQPSLAILDEIDSGVSKEKLLVFFSLISQLLKSGTSFLVITHNIDIWQEYMQVNQTHIVNNGNLDSQ